jgi:hypothetical protein
LGEFESPIVRQRLGWLPGHVDHFVLVAGDVRVAVTDIAVFSDAVSLVLVTPGGMAVAAACVETRVGAWSGRLPPDLESPETATALLGLDEAPVRVIHAEANESVTRTTLWLRGSLDYVYVTVTDAADTKADGTISGASLREARAKIDRVSSRSY